MPGGRIDILVEPDLRTFPSKLQSGLQGSVGVASRIGSGIGLALGGGVLAAGAGFKKIIDLTTEFQGNLNSLQAVTGATGAEMEAVSAKATQLGNDITLPGTSASTAAAAMLELAKGGLTVQQAMDAAKGTLTLAAAAQVDGARAAQIQSDALNIFGLQATEASRVADILANASNASAVEITDVAESMKYAGPVARSMGISIQDTATAVALLGNNGIRGSEAGTALRGMLASLISPSKEAAKSINLLGLQTRDSQGNFVGFESIITQLRAAQGNLTKAQFEGAVATAFGRETMSGVLALVNSAPDAWDKMSAAVTRQGGAQDVAAAKMKGLGGAIEAFKGQAETTAIQVGTALAPALEKVVRGGTGLLGFLTDAATGAGNLTERFPGLNRALEVGRGLWSDFTTILGNARDAARPVVDTLDDLADSAGGEGGAISAIATGLEHLGDAAVGASELLGPVGEVLAGVLSVAAGLPGPLQAAALAYLAFKVVPGILSAVRGESDQAAASTGRLGRAVDAVTAPAQGARAALRQFHGEMRVQQALAAASGQSLTRLGAAQAAFETSTLGAVVAVRNFRDDVRTLQAAAAGAGAPISRLEAAIGALAQRSPAAAAMAGSFQAVSGAVTTFGDRAAAGARSAAESLGTNLVPAVRNTVSAVAAVPGVAASAGAALRTALGDGARAALDGVRALGTGTGSALGSVRDAVRDLPATVGSGLRAVGEAARDLPRLIGDGFRAIPGAVETGISAIGRFTGVVAGAGASLGTGLLRGAGSLVSFLGGPWGVALAGAGLALSLLGQRQQEAAQKAQEHQQALDSIAGTLDKYNGAVTQATVTEKARQLAADGTLAKVKDLGISTADYTQATLGNADALGRVQQQLGAHTRTLIEQSAAYQGGQRELRALGLSLDDLTAAALGNGPAMDRVQAAIASVSDLDAQTQMRGLVEGMVAAGSASGDLARELGISNGELAKIQEQTRLASEASNDFAGKLDFLKAGLGGLAQGAAPTEQLRAGFAGLATSAGEAAQRAGESAAAIGGVAAGGAAAAQAMQQSRDAFIGAAQAAGLTKDQAEALATQIGLIPAVARTNFETNATGVAAELGTLKAQFDAVPESKTVTVNALSDEAKAKLTDLGFTVTTLPNGQIEVTANTDPARANLDAAVADANSRTGTVTIEGNKDPVTGKITQSVRLADGSTGTITVDGNPDPATGEIRGTVRLADGSTGTITIDGNRRPSDGKIDGTVRYANGSTGTIKVDANDDTARSSVAGTVRWINTLKAKITVTAQYSGLSPAQVRMAGAAGGIVKGMHDGGVLGMAGGGVNRGSAFKTRPMRGGIAQIVPPNTWRIIGDRIRDDEAFIPINRSARSRRIFEETARRMGYQVARMYAEGGVAARATTAVAAQRVAAAASTDLRPVVVELAALRRDVAQVRSVTYSPTINNPVAEPAAATKASDLRTAAALRVLV